MKNILFVSLIIFLVLYSCTSGKTARTATYEDITIIYKFAQQSTWLLGYFNADRLKHEPHSEWFVKEHDNYKLDAKVVNKLLDIPKEDIEIKVVLGTWCSDSRKQVPRFMKIIDLWGFPVSKMTFIGVDDAKISPVGEYESLNIQRVPTFIFFEKNIEAGRIIENPLTSLEQDMVNILK
jgi:hypothetical protein